MDRRNATQRIQALRMHLDNMQDAMTDFKSALNDMQNELPSLKNAMEEPFDLVFLMEDLAADINNIDTDEIDTFMVDLEIQIEELSYNFIQASEKLSIATHMYKPKSPLIYQKISKE